MKKLKTIFLGTPDFSVPALDMLYNHPQIELALVISMPDRPAGRGYHLKSPEVIEYAREKKINFFQTENINKEEALINELSNGDIDLIIVLAFAQFLNKKILNLPKLGCYNIHTSLLPKYRGAAPIQYALLNGDKSTGVSIQKMVLKMDAGAICWSHELQVDASETGGQLYTRLKFQAALALNDFISKLIKDDITFTDQDESKVSFAPTLKKEDGFLNFKNSDSNKILNQIRALDPWPGTYCNLDNKRLKVFSLEKTSDINLKPGESKVIKNQLFIGCLDCTFRLLEVQLEGKKRTSDIDLLNGYKGNSIIN